MIKFYAMVLSVWSVVALAGCGAEVEVDGASAALTQFQGPGQQCGGNTLLCGPGLVCKYPRVLDRSLLGVCVEVQQNEGVLYCDDPRPCPKGMVCVKPTAGPNPRPVCRYDTQGPDLGLPHPL